MKSDNKRPLISCIAFVCKNAKSAKKEIFKKLLTNEIDHAIINNVKWLA